MSHYDYEDITDTEDDDSEESNTKNNINSSFKEYNVKKIKPSKEIFDGFQYDNINYLKISNGQEGYLHAYSIHDYLRFKLSIVSLGNVSRIDVHNINSQQFIDNIFKFNIPIECFSHEINKTNNILKSDEFIMGFIDENNNKILLYLDYATCTIFYIKNKDKKENSTIQQILGILENYTEPKVNKNKIYVVHKSQNGFDKTGFTIKKVNINITENYNDDFVKVAQEIISGLNKKNKTNLVILSGCPGSGKTTFIRYMASRLKKNIIFISPDMVSYITDPSFIPFLIKNNDSILIIEDAEPALETRDTGRTGAVSNILNLTDGLLSDCLNISIVATFNTESNRIDSALLRKGRLLKNYKFEKLSIDKSNNLLKKLGHNVSVKEPMSLADIYYYESDNNAPETTSHKAIAGFGRR